MKKTLIAVAALAATSAFAQNVAVTGTVDATYRSSTVNYQNGTSGGQNAIGQNGSGTTNFTLVGSEDLGGGLKAILNTEFDFLAQGSDTAGQEGPVQSGQLFVGLEGAFGSVKIGKPNSPTLTVQGSRSAFGTKDGGRVAVSGAGSTLASPTSSSGPAVMGVSITRQTGSILYTSPNFSGFSVQLDYAPGAKTDAAASIAEAGAKTDIGAFYANGPIAAGVTRYTEAAAGAGSEKGLTSYYGSYDFKVAKLTLGGHQYKQDSASIDNAGYGAAVDVPLSPALTLNAHFVKVDDKSTADLDTTMSAIGLNYALSKRTSTYVRYVNQKTDNTTAATAVKDASEYMVGLRHNF